MRDKQRTNNEQLKIELLSQWKLEAEFRKNLSSGEISDVYTWQMGRNLKNVAEFQISPHERCGEL